MTTQTPTIEACREAVARGASLPPFLARWLVEEYERLQAATNPFSQAVLTQPTPEEPMTTNERRPVVAEYGDGRWLVRRG